MSEAYNMLRTRRGLPKEGIVAGREGGKAGRQAGQGEFWRAFTLCACPSLSSQTYSDAILQLVAAAGGLSQPGGQDLELDQPGDGGCWHLVVTPVKSQQNTRPGAGWAFFLSPSEMGRDCQSSI